ncbi:MAG: carboxypeptidase regulatory-like domain-containing protein [Nitrososphaerota archaeon]|nr:carboxypeptidase regulatory-like domain-containing protein [Nitrososphaerota archaeon]MDG7021902.1 carboxypeptidase regulatory-like domain-containing protein [Nitrososphaerota archaeon]
MEVKLDDIDLVKRTQSSATSPLSEVRAVYDVHVEGRRSIVELKVPGSSGNVLQDMGREPITILLKGEVWGPDAKTTIQALRAKADSGESAPFSSDLLAAASVSEVIVEEFEVDQLAGNPTRYRYLMLLREYKEGGQATEGEAAGTDEVQEREAEEASAEEAAAEAAKEGEVHDVRVQLRDHSGNLIPGVEVTIEGPDGTHKAKTDEEGYVVVKDAKEGKYDISVSEDRFGDVKVQVEVKKKGDGAGTEGQGV